MSGNADTIKDFLVSLGFDIDQAGANKFEAVLKGVTANVLKVGAVVEGAALSIVGFTTQIANGLDKIYWASQRTGASVQGIKALGYAASQTGASAESAMSSLEGLAGFMRSNPGAEGFLNRLGVQTRDASGKMRDTAAIFTGVGQKLNNMPYYRAKQYAQMLGIDENTLMAMRRGMGQLSSEYALTAKRIGFNAESAAKQSNIFMTSMRNLTMTLGQAKDKIGSNLAGGLAGSIDNFRRQILDNWPKIEAVITKIIKGILWAGDAITRVLWRTGQAVEGVIAWFKKLNPATQQLIALFSGLLVAWRLLNTAFMSSPLGMITTLIIALGLLLDDYQAWKEGGKSLIDWGKWKTEIDQAVKMIGDLKKTVTDLTKALAKLLGIDPKSWSLKWDFSNFISQMGEFGKMLNMIADLLNAIKDGNWAQAASIGKQLINHGSENPSAMPMVTDSANGTADWIKEHWGFDPRSVGRTVRGWFGDDEPDIPGAEQHVRSNEIAPHERDEIKNRQQAANGYLEKISDGIAKIGNLFFSPVGAAEISPNISGDPSQFAQSVKRPQATAQGKVLLDWMGPMFNKLESLYQLPAGLLKSVAITESGGNQFAISGAGAKGLFQFMDGTARDMGLRGNDVFDPEKSAQAAAKYLSQLLRQNGGDLSKALASYNWGIGNVKRYGMGLMPQETRNYIPKVMSNMPTSAPVIQQETNINIHGVSDPREAARLTVDRQKGVNSQLTQQLPAGPR
ncbi:MULTISPECIES: transglycosylase SLT domain-containing protein [Enterobacteriaceae]|uniref:transglycosylase SLT domain-containing protein n=1 Tax=Enterobacteriaceae TaxID=543 RepID=UPI000CD18D5E|nr:MULTISPECIES: transglycosylase SLT domain-containing protein [Enterobacteriaceae]AUV30036.1 lytic transglycosylase [Escherichia coli]MBL6018701.1 transglycosylase SLT domain-containing protein [Enterobacter hormaechei]MBL6023724.1 transglycosylase SLT domain-containing protein [Enterobacter hormaechei]MBL6053679.1 transglycosylase SLT domain-containing protein [Enterobacter hormaechei]MBL6058692.1 transglycosylase SLT domain-containing protein [Enterobacter hormaechei]